MSRHSVFTHTESTVPMPRTLVIGLLVALLARPVFTAQVGSARDSLKDLQTVRVEVQMERNPSAARNGVEPDWVRDIVERRLEQLDVELSQGGKNPDGTYLTVAVNPARAAADGFAVSISLKLFQPATLANDETVMAATWHADSLDFTDADGLQEDTRRVLQNHLELLGADYRAANEP